MAQKKSESEKKTNSKTSAKKTAAKSTKKSGGKKKSPVISIIIIALIAIFAVWYLFFNGKTVTDDFLSKNFGTTSGELISQVLDDGSSSDKTTTSSQTSTASKPAAKLSDSVKAANDSYATKQIEVPLCPATLNGSASDHEVHEYNGFQLCYRETYEDAEWVAYVLTKEELNAVTSRDNKFHADPKISTGSATPKDYTSTGYDRGHLAPAADLIWSEESMKDSFLMSNMTPQAPDFNRGRWKDLEDEVRKWADRFGEVTVVTGPILEKDASEYKKIGANEVAVPEYFYKALLAKSNGKRIGIGFILPNTKCDEDIWYYAVSIDEVESRTGLDFFSSLKDSEEDAIESSTDFSAWK